MIFPSFQLRERLLHDSIRLFCFPCAGGSATAYTIWQRHVPPWIEVLPVELPGRGSRFSHPMAPSLTELADDLARELRRYACVPCAVFGHSMGALIAYEVAKRLASTPGCLLRKLFVSGSPAPIQRKQRQPPVSSYSNADLMRLLTDMNGTSPQVLADVEMMKLVLPRLRADYTLCETYVDAEDANFSLPIASICGDQDSDASEQDMQIWAGVSRGEFTSHVVPGGHFFIQDRIQELMKILDTELSEFRMSTA